MQYFVIYITVIDMYERFQEIYLSSDQDEVNSLVNFLVSAVVRLILHDPLWKY